jgi:hypothetical protein
MPPELEEDYQRWLEAEARQELSPEERLGLDWIRSRPSDAELIGGVSHVQHEPPPAPTDPLFCPRRRY